MQGTQEMQGAKIVHESVAETETSGPGLMAADIRGIDEIKQGLFSASPSGKDQDQNLAVQSENGQDPPQGTSQQSTDANSSVRSLGFSVHSPVENEEAGPPQCAGSEPVPERRSVSRTSSRSSGYAGSEQSEEHCLAKNVDPHDPNYKAFLHRTSSDSLNNSHSRESYRVIYERALRSESCNTCHLLKDACQSKETMELWDSIEWCGSDDKNNCHCKFWSVFLKTLKEKFPAEDGLKNKQVVHLLKTLLGVKEAEDGEISCSNLVRIVRFLGPLKKDPQDKCILIRHLDDIVKRSLVKVNRKGKSLKQSWFAGDMTRDEAEQRLQNENYNTYLVRMSQSGAEEGNFVVSVKDENGIHHFEIEGNPVESFKSSGLNCYLLFNGNQYESLAGVIEDLIYNPIKDEEERCEVWCKYICPDLPFNTIITPYKHTHRR